MIDNRDRLEQYLDENKSAVTPQPLWWVLLATVKFLMDLIDVCFKSIQGKDTLVPEQKNHLQSLAEPVIQLVDVTPVNAVYLIQLADTQQVVAKKRSRFKHIHR